MLIYIWGKHHVYLISDLPEKKKQQLCLRNSVHVVLLSYFKLFKCCNTFLIQFINFQSLQVKREQIFIITHVTLLGFFTFADFSMLEATQHSPKQNMYHLAEKEQMIIFSNYEFSVSIAGAQMINVNTFFCLVALT